MTIRFDPIAVGHADARCGAIPGEDDVPREVDSRKVGQRTVIGFKNAHILELQVFDNVRDPALAEAFPGENIDAAEALAWGLVDIVAPHHQLDEAVDRLARPILAAGARAIRLQKSLILDWEELPISAAVQRGIECFVSAFETDEPAAFLDLVQRLRTTEASSYTKRDTPTFTCVACSVERALNALDGTPLTIELTAQR